MLLKTDISELPIMAPEMRAIPVYRKIIERNRTTVGDHDGRKKKHNIKELAFIHLYTHFLLRTDPLNPLINPYWKFSPDDRLVKLKTDLEFPDNWVIDEELQKAIEHYTENVVKEFDMLALEACMQAAMATLTYWKGVDYERRDTKGNFIYKPKEVIASIGEVNKLITELNSARDKILSNMKVANTKVRGGGLIGSREVPKR